jgi:hypothetical protein
LASKLVLAQYNYSPKSSQVKGIPRTQNQNPDILAELKSGYSQYPPHSAKKQHRPHCHFPRNPQGNGLKKKTTETFCFNCKLAERTPNSKICFDRILEKTSHQFYFWFWFHRNLRGSDTELHLQLQRNQTSSDTEFCLIVYRTLQRKCTKVIQILGSPHFNTERQEVCFQYSQTLISGRKLNTRRAPACRTIPLNVAHSDCKRRQNAKPRASRLSPA